MVQAFVNFSLVVLLMNEKDGGGRIKHTAIKKEANQKQNRLKLFTSCGQVKRYKIWYMDGKPHQKCICAHKITTINSKFNTCPHKTQQWR